MKKLLMLTAFIWSVMLSPVVHAGWTKVIKNEIGDDFYVNFERIKKYSDKVYCWELIGFF